MKQNNNAKKPYLVFDDRYNKMFEAMLNATEGLKELVGGWLDCLPHKDLAIYCESQTDVKIDCVDWQHNKVECELIFGDAGKDSLTLRMTRGDIDMVIIIKPVSKDCELPSYDNENVYDKFDLQEKKGEQGIIEFDKTWYVKGDPCIEIVNRYNYDLILCEGEQMLGMRLYDYEGAYSPEIYPVEKDIFMIDSGVVAGA